jgi:hypothetical protein
MVKEALAAPVKPEAVATSVCTRSPAGRCSGSRRCSLAARSAAPPLGQIEALVPQVMWQRVGRRCQSGLELHRNWGKIAPLAPDPG